MRPDHTCKPPRCPGIHLSRAVAAQIGVEWKPPCPLVPFTCECGRRWKVYGRGWVPEKTQQQEENREQH